MIVTLCTGSACATDEATRACPISWWATMSRSFSDRTRLFFSSPATIRSIASSKSAVVTASFSLRAASRAPSLTMFARSAPAKPGVRAAITPRSTSGASTTARACSLKIASRPRTSGLSTTTWRSKRPGRSSARSRTSGRFVAAMRITPFDESKPSISARSWFRVCSRSSWPPMNPVAHARGADADEHLDELRAGEREERHVGLARDGARQERLARARRADQEHALRDAPAEPLVLLRVPEEIDDLDELGLCLVDARDVGERRLELLAVEDLVLGAPERQGLRGPAPHPAHQEHPDRDHDAEREDPAEEEVTQERRLDLARELDPVRLELGNEPLLVDAGDAGDGEDANVRARAEQLAQPVAGPVPRRRQGVGLRDAPDLPVGDRDPLDLVGAQELEELRHRELDGPGRQEPGLQQRQHDHRDEQVGERKLEALGEPRFHQGPQHVMLAFGMRRVKRAGPLFP